MPSFDNLESMVLPLDETRAEDVAAVRAALAEGERAKPRSLGGVLTILALSLLFFVGERSANAGETAVWVAVLVAVILVHELGHLVAMRAFGYSDLRVFFVPFLGAAASGRKQDATAMQRAVVSLMGPLPGLVGTLALAFSAPFDSSVMTTVFTLALFLNAFNLLPFVPLDGGRFLEVALFSRWPLGRTVTRVLGGIALVVIGLQLGSWMLAIFGGLGAFFGLGSHMHGRGAEQLRVHVDASQPLPPTIPDALVPAAMALANQHVFNGRSISPTPRHYANVIRGFWDQVGLRPPGLGGTLALLGSYAAAWGLVAATLVVVMWRDPSGAALGANGCDPDTERERMRREAARYDIDLGPILDGEALDTKLSALRDCPALTPVDPDEQEARRQRENLVEAVLARHPFDPGACLVDAQVEHQADVAVQILAWRGLTLADAGIERDDLAQALRPGAEKAVRKFLLLAVLAQRDDPQINDAELDTRLAALATQYGQTLDELRADPGFDGVLELERETLHEEKLLERLRLEDPSGQRTNIPIEALEEPGKLGCE